MAPPMIPMAADSATRHESISAMLKPMARSIAISARRWRTDIEWWKGDGATARDHLTLRTADGTVCEVYGDRRAGGWYLQRLLD